MTQVMFQKVRGILVPCDPATEHFLETIKPGEGLGFDAKLKRRVKQHRRAFGLLRLGFDAWEPITSEDTVGVVKSFDLFREDILILAGHFERVHVTRFAISARGPDGRFLKEPRQVGEATIETQLRAKSISFASMDEQPFAELYRRILEVMWEKVLRWINYSSPDEVDHVVSQLLRFE